MPKSVKDDPNRIIKKMCEDHPNEVLAALLEAPFWPSIITTDASYERYEDDTRFGQLNLNFSRDGDAWIATIPDPNDRNLMLRFRTYHGGGQSLRVRAALTFLAVAIELDNKERLQQR